MVRSEAAEQASRELQEAVLRARELLTTQQIVRDAVLAALASEENENWAPGVYAGAENYAEVRRVLRVLRPPEVE